MKKLTLSLALVLLGVLLSCSDMFAASQQARYIFMQNITANSATAKWLYNGDGAGRLVVVRADNSWGDTETALGTTTSAFADVNGSYGTAPQIGATGSYVVDVHTGISKQIALSGLASGTTYWIRIFEWDEDAGEYDYFTTSGGFNNPRSFVTLTAVPQPPTDITITAGNCDFDISWTAGVNSTGTIMSLFYDDTDSLCADIPTGVLGTFSAVAGDTIPTDWIDIDLGDLTSIEGFPIENFNADHLVRMWGYNGNVDNVSSTFTDEMFTPIEDCDGPTFTITVFHLIWQDSVWVVGDSVGPGACEVGGRYRVYVNWTEPVEDFDETSIILAGATMVGGTWIASENLEDYQFDIETSGLTGEVGIDIDGLYADCVGNEGGSGEYNIPPLNLLSTENFAVLSGAGITGTTNTAITGDVGTSPIT
ncbi:MAG: hypothetical protein M9949_02135 [Candidatus Kapabacteria bacterium]|nr:hypothetical protein [Candidatus Kapabacteria bacterium]